MTESKVFEIGSTRLQPVFGDITTLNAEALVQPAGTSPGKESFYFQASPWVIKADTDGSIRADLARHAPLEIGQVIVTTAGELPARYLLHAVVVNWSHLSQVRQGEAHRAAFAPEHNKSDAVYELVADAAIDNAARQCIRIANALKLSSIAFTPWGTSAADKEIAHSTAIMLQAIVVQLQQQPTSLKTVFLISNHTAHYESFLDRSFIFGLFARQMERVRAEIQHLRVSPQELEKLASTIAQAQQSVITNYNQYVTVEKGNYQPKWTVESVNQAMGDVNVEGKGSGALPRSD